MIVKLKMNLKIANGEILSMGTVLDTEDGNFPVDLIDDVNDSRYMEIIEGEAPVVKAPAAPKAAAKGLTRRKG